MRTYQASVRTLMRTGTTFISYPHTINISHHTPDELRELFGSMGITRVLWRIAPLEVGGNVRVHEIDVEVFIISFDKMRRPSPRGNLN